METHNVIDCPHKDMILSLHKTVYIGNGTPALTVQISNLATKIDTVQRLIAGAIVGIPAIYLLFQWTLHAMGVSMHVIAGN